MAESHRYNVYSLNYKGSPLKVAQTPEILCSGLLSFNDLSLALTLAADPLALDRHTLWEKLTTFPPLPDPRAHTAEGVTSDLAAIPRPLCVQSGQAGQGLPGAVRQQVHSPPQG